MINLSTLLPILLFAALGCGTFQSTGDPDAPKVERGRLKFSKSVTAINVGRNPIVRDVQQSFYVNGKKWSPEGEKDFANKINWCDTSPNPKVEILRCFGDASESYNTTYILRMKDDKPEIQKIDEGLPVRWINDDGRWLLFSRLFLNAETGEKIDINAPSPVDPKESSVFPMYLLGVSPDMKTIVQLPDNSTKKEGAGAEEFLVLWIIEADTGKLEKRKVSFTKNPWLKDYKEPSGDVQYPPEPSKKFVWEKDAGGRDRLTVPQLLETIEPKPVKK